MRQLSLRTRLLMAVGLLALVQVIAAFAIISATSDRLLDQVDERLVAAVSSVQEADFGGESLAGGSLLTEADRLEVEGLGDVYQGIFTADGTLLTLNVVFDRGEVVPPPTVSPTALQASFDGPTTVEAERGQVEYRLMAVELGTADTLVLSIPLDGYEFAMNRLTQLVITVAIVMMLVIGAVTWWVLRLGIEPIKHMTSTAEAIAAGDLSERIDELDPATEAGQLGMALNTMMGRIEASFEEKTAAETRLRQFMADASHELRTPVATIRGYAELYQAGGLDQPAELDDAMSRTAEESQRMSRLIADMLNLAKLDRGPTLRIGSVDLGTLAREVVTDAAATYENRTIQAVVDQEPVVVAGDEDLLRQAITNLVNNAIVHTEDGATATVVAAGDGVAATVVVSDDGDGMADHVVERATERFFRADRSRSRSRGGSGLGLAIVDSVVAAHHGELAIESAPGHGTTVRFTIPVVRSVAASQPTHS